MAGTYLTWLADTLRAAGLTVIEVSGWQTRARGSGGYTNNRPWIVMLHHTASPPSWDGKRDADYCATGDPSAPLSNLYIDRKGQVWVLAAGATNTNGKGRSRPTSKGTVPQDSMNSYAVGIEMGNNGVGEVWPAPLIDSMFTTTIALLDKLGLADSDVGLHEWYSPGRKIDPATCNVAGPWVPNPWNSSGTWDLDAVWAEITNRRVGGAPPPDDEEDDVKAAVYQANDDPQGPWLWWDGRGMGWVRDAAQLDVGRVMGVYANSESAPLKNFSKAQLAQIASSSWADSGPRPQGY